MTNTTIYDIISYKVEVRGIEELLIKYKDVCSLCNDDFVHTKSYKGLISDIIPTLKHVDRIILKDGFYHYISSEFKPSDEIGGLDVLYIHVENCEDYEDGCGLM